MKMDILRGVGGIPPYPTPYVIDYLGIAGAVQRKDG
jgi:hypothetical protein